MGGYVVGICLRTKFLSVIKPMDEEAIVSLAKETGAVVTAEIKETIRKVLGRK